MRTVIIIIMTLTSHLISAGPALASGQPQPITPQEWLIIGGIGQYGRSAVHTDVIEAQLVAGSWRPPQAGETIVSAQGKTQTWEPLKPADDGWLSHRALRGGYAYAVVRSDRERTVLLQASGHSIVYVNGEPRGGDPYATGWIQHPVELLKGENHLLFLCRRGRVRAQLIEPRSTVQFNPKDTTLPDLIRGSNTAVWAAIPVINATKRVLSDLSIEASFDGGSVERTRIDAIQPMSFRKVGFRVAAAHENAPEKLQLNLRLLGRSANSAPFDTLDSTALQLRVRNSDQKHKRTFISTIDDSVQYYAVTPMHRDDSSPESPALVLTLHGAGVEALGQANAYGHKDWAHIVAATNRRPFGFDWEDWGRWDALEVLNLAERSLGTDPRRTYLTGHSMGGHGTWHLGTLFADRFAAIAPSAGWISFRSYSRSAPTEDRSAMDHMLRRATNGSDTLSRSHNLKSRGVYILHGDKDNNVPVSEARTMRKHLADFHSDFAYYERPGAGHWWGNECVDWPPLFEFLKRHETPKSNSVHELQFTTPSPAVAASHHWATIAAQPKPLEISSIDLKLDVEKRTITGTTINVSRLAIDFAKLTTTTIGEPEEQTILERGSPVTVTLDDSESLTLPWTFPAQNVWLEHSDGQWTVASAPAATLKNPKRYGPFKEAFNHRFILVYGTAGTPEENMWSYNKARFDAETFSYRGNSSVEIASDTEFDPQLDRDRSVILYGHSESNSAWATLLHDNPVQVSRNRIQVGETKLTGAELACLFVQPRPGSDIALVGVITGTDLPGMRLTTGLGYFVSGVGYPDFTVLHADMLTDGTSGVVAAGFFGEDWSADDGEFVWVLRQ